MEIESRSAFNASVRLNGRSIHLLRESLVFQKNVQWFVDRLVERMLPSIGSFISSALQRMLILNHAEHHNQLEEQALRYEAAGREDIANLIRQHARNLSLEKPLPLADAVLSEFEAENPSVFEAAAMSPLALPEPKKRKKKRSQPPVEVKGEE